MFLSKVQPLVLGGFIRGLNWAYQMFGLLFDGISHIVVTTIISSHNSVHINNVNRKWDENGRSIPNFL